MKIDWTHKDSTTVDYDNLKEILEEEVPMLQLTYGNYVSLNKYLRLKDYITNLQQENERLKEKYDNSKSHQINYNYFKTLYEKATKDIVIDDLVYKCEDLYNLRQSYEKLYIEKEDYKSRCEKAIEYVKEHNPSDIGICGNEKKYYYTLEEDSVDNLLNILQNGSDSQ